MALRKDPRSCRTDPGWRLATVEEAKDNLEWIKHNHLLGEWDRARLLDGWIGGSGYDWHVQVGFRSCLGYMLVVQTPTPEISNADSRNTVLYSNVRMSKEGANAALFLCCEDWNYEVLLWLIEGQKEEGRPSVVAITVDDKTEAASKLVSAVARELHGLHGKIRVMKPEFSSLSMRSLMMGIQESVRDISKHDILSKALFSTELMDIGDHCWEEMGLTEDLQRFQDLGFDTSVDSIWDDVANAVWYAAAEPWLS